MGDRTEPQRRWKVLVTGSRRWRHQQLLASTLERVEPTEICHGDAPGADRMADAWAKANGIPVTPYPADWGRYQRAAGAIRNREMIADFKPDQVVAFKDRYGEDPKGTEDMVEVAAAAHVPVLIIDTDPLPLPPSLFD